MAFRSVMKNDMACTLEAYEHWAPVYPPVPHNPLMRAEQRAMLEHWPDVAGRIALDLASGTGRYAQLLTETHAADIVALDFCAPMLARGSATRRVCASMMQLPFANDTFDVIVSGLAIGHATTLDAWMAEVARVLKPGGTLLYSDFHPEAARASLTRSFNDEHNRTWTVPHVCYGVTLQLAAATAAGLTIDIVRELRVGAELHESFSRSEEFYERWRGLPIVLVVRAQK